MSCLILAADAFFLGILTREKDFLYGRVPLQSRLCSPSSRHWIQLLRCYQPKYISEGSWASVEYIDMFIILYSYISGWHVVSPCVGVLTASTTAAGYGNQFSFQ
jgi:hypothetical protein